MGEHRFSRYALIFRITETLAGPVRLRAETRAEFPGAGGASTAALVIGTRGHVVAAHSILRRPRAAERADTAERRHRARVRTPQAGCLKRRRSGIQFL